jgi:DNA-binding transcriptional LysR family regulator
MAFVCHPGHRLARRRAVGPEDLNAQPFVAFDRELTIRKAIDRALRQRGVKPNVVMEFDNIETIKQAIMIDAGVSLLPRHTVEKEAHVRTLAVVPFTLPGLVRPVGMIHRRQRPLAPAVGRFIELLQAAASAEGARSGDGGRLAARRGELPPAGGGTTILRQGRRDAVPGGAT